MAVSLQFDDFYDVCLPALDSLGYIITQIQRYNPTTVTGTTPKGASFTFTVNDTTWTLTYRSRQHSGSVTDPQWYTSPSVQTALTNAVTAAGG